MAVLFSVVNKIVSTQLVNKWSVSTVDKLFDDMKLHLSKSRTDNSRSHSKNLNDDELVDMLFLLYLDGVHDKYLVKVNFIEFLQTGYIREIVRSDVLSFVKKYASSGKVTPTFQKFYNIPTIPEGVKKNIYTLYNGTRTFSGGYWSSPENKKATKQIIGASWEVFFKKNVVSIFPGQVKDVIEIDSINKLLTSKSRGDSRIYVGVDQEAESQPISEIIDTSMNDEKYFLYPYVSLGVLLDPGNTMVRNMLKKDIAHLLSNSPSIGLMYDVEPTVISLSWKNKPFFVIEAGQIELPPISKPENLLGQSVFTVRINGWLVPIGASAGEARANDAKKGKFNKFTKGFVEFGKFMGDGLQYMYLASKPKQRNPRAFCSGDGMACASYMFYSKLFGKTDPPLIIDGGATQGSRLTIYNISDNVNLQSTKPKAVQAASNLTGVAMNVNSSPNKSPTSKLNFNKMTPAQKTALMNHLRKTGFTALR